MFARIASAIVMAFTGVLLVVGLAFAQGPAPAVEKVYEITTGPGQTVTPTVSLAGGEELAVTRIVSGPHVIILAHFQSSKGWNMYSLGEAAGGARLNTKTKKYETEGGWNTSPSYTGTMGLGAYYGAETANGAVTVSFSSNEEMTYEVTVRAIEELVKVTPEPPDAGVSATGEWRTVKLVVGETFTSPVVLHREDVVKIDVVTDTVAVDLVFTSPQLFSGQVVPHGVKVAALQKKDGGYELVLPVQGRAGELAFELDAYPGQAIQGKVKMVTTPDSGKWRVKLGYFPAESTTLPAAGGAAAPDRGPILVPGGGAEWEPLSPAYRLALTGPLFKY